MQDFRLDLADLRAATRTFYRHALAALKNAKVPFLVCGSCALEAFTGIARHAKDLDICVRRSDCARTLECLSRTGYRTELTFAHWLGKAFCGDDFLDVIFNSGNGECAVDDNWFDHAVRGEILGMQVQFCPPEELIWQQAFVMERERFDGADVAHLLRAQSKELDWKRLLDRFGPHWRVLLAHLTLFGFIYPAHRSEVPEAVILELLRRFHLELGGQVADAPYCQGTLLSRAQYLVDIQHWGYGDVRLPPQGKLSAEQLQPWTAAIQEAPARMRCCVSAAEAMEFEPPATGDLGLRVTTAHLLPKL